MKKEIEDVIRQHLPQQVGETLRKRLDQAEHDADVVNRQKHQLVKKDEEINALRERIEQLENQVKEEEQLEKDREEVDGKIRDQKVFEAELKADAAEARANEMAGFVGMVFKSPVFRKSISGHQDIPDAQGGMMYGNYSRDEYNETE